MSRKPVIGLALAIAIVVGLIILGGIYLWQGRFLSSGPPAEKLTIGVGTSEGMGLLFVAEDQGFLKGNGLDADIKTYQSGKAALDATMAGKLDVCCCAEFAVVYQIMTGQRQPALPGNNRRRLHA